MEDYFRIFCVYGRVSFVVGDAPAIKRKKRVKKVKGSFNTLMYPGLRELFESQYQNQQQAVYSNQQMQNQQKQLNPYLSELTNSSLNNLADILLGIKK